MEKRDLSVERRDQIERMVALAADSARAMFTGPLFTGPLTLARDGGHLLLGEAKPPVAGLAQRTRTTVAVICGERSRIAPPAVARRGHQGIPFGNRG